MTELERLLQNALSELSEQYKADMRRLKQQVERLSLQLQRQEEQQRRLLQQYNEIAALLREELER